ncbi:flagellar biosynthetic protein FliR [Pseudomonas stutzeri]|nr:flagellar biosynthetic protein FliR [Stutzerimonas stutzeri]
MVEVDFAQLQLWLTTFFWPFVRLTAFLAASPLWGHDSVPMRVKIGLAALLAVLLGPTLPPLPAVPLVSWTSLGILVEQMAIGIAIGLTMRVTFAVVQAAGEIVGLQMGLGFATFFAPDTGTNTMILSRLLYMFSLLIFLALNGHLIVLEILAASFASLPIGQTLDPGAGIALVRHAGIVIASGLLLALPLVAALLTINLAMGILNRASPQLTVFAVGFPLTLTVGLVLLMVLMNDLGRFLEGLFGDALLFLRTFVDSLAAAG